MGMDDTAQAAVHGGNSAEADLRPEVTRLLEAALRQRDAGHLVDAIVAAVQAHLGMEVAFLTRFAGDRQEFVAAAGDTGSFGLAAGDTTPLEDGYCARVARGDLPAAIPDAADDPRVNRMPITSALDIGAYVGVPVRLPDGEPFGSLCCFSHGARPDMDERDVGFLRVLAAIVAGELGRDADRAVQRRIVADHIAGVLQRGRVAMRFQPVVRLGDGTIAGVEALARFGGGDPSRSPDAWFADAWTIGAGPELELLAVREALAAADRLPEGAYLSLNVDPRTAVSAAFAELLDARPDGRRILVELTEHALVHGYDRLRETMRRLRRSNVRFAVDDVGAGYAGLSRLAVLHPTYVKLDRGLVRGIDSDPARMALVRALAEYARDTDAMVVAEGVETRKELARVRDAGASLVQGYLLARPQEPWPGFDADPLGLEPLALVG